jgi:hypothetical protein
MTLLIRAQIVRELSVWKSGRYQPGIKWDKANDSSPTRKFCAERAAPFQRLGKQYRAADINIGLVDALGYAGKRDGAVHGLEWSVYV